MKPEAWELVEKFRHGFNGIAACCIDINISDSILPSGEDIEVRIYGPTFSGSAKGNDINYVILKAVLSGYLNKHDD